jgi:hypothetical protein
MMAGHEDDTHPDADAPEHEDEHTHEGSFATGQEETVHHPERVEEREDFAEGQEAAKHTHEGSFAEGQEERDHHPERPEERGDFAEGQEEDQHHGA